MAVPKQKSSPSSFPSRKVQPKQPRASKQVPETQRQPKPSSLSKQKAQPTAQEKSKKEEIAQADLPVCQPAEGSFAWNFDNSPIMEMVKQMSRLDCAEMVFDESVKTVLSKRVYAWTQDPISLPKARRMFELALESNGLVLMRVPTPSKNRRRLYTITKRDDATRMASPVYGDDDRLPSGKQMVTVVLELKHLSGSTVRSALRSLLSRAGSIHLVGDGFVVLVDGASNILRIKEVLAEIDVPGVSDQAHMIELSYAEAEDVQKKLEQIFDVESDHSPARRAHARNKAKSPGVNDGSGDDFSIQKIIADERTNRLMIIASKKGFERIKEVVAMLDKPPADGFSQDEIHVYHVKHGDAEKIAKSLEKVVRSGGSSSSKRTTGAPRPPMPTGEVFEGEVRVSADESTNSLLIVASSKDYRAIRGVIDRLDKKRLQVHIEATIMDILLNDGNEFGLNVFGGFPVPGGGFGVAGNPGGQTLAKSTATALAQGNDAGSALAMGNFISTLGVMGPSDLSIPGTSISVPSFGAVLHAVQTMTNVDVLATPTVTVLNNEKADMSVGSRIPVSEGTISLGASSSASNLGIPLNQINYHDAKLELFVTPHVNEDGQVRMEIEQKVSDLGGQISVGKDETRPSFDTKSVKTVVVSKDQQTLVIGGLISSKTTIVEAGVPILSQIPLLGLLFKKKEKRVQKRNLVLVLTPYVIQNDGDYQKLLHRKMREREEFSRMMLGRKAAPHNPYISYDEKLGPLQKTMQQVHRELQKVENGGPGTQDETIIRDGVERSGALLENKKPSQPTSESVQENVPVTQSEQDQEETSGQT
ncbi:MAG: type II secretion system secretin GspD [Myxococcota bacterium]